MKSWKQTIYATSVLAGTIIGVGLFALPYITVKVGIGVIVAYFVFLTGIVILIHRFFAEVALQTPDFLRLPSYAKIHLGKWGKKITLTSGIFGLWGALLAYLIIGGEFLTVIFSPVVPLGVPFCALLYFVLGAGLILYGIKGISKIEFWGLIFFFVALAAVFYKGWPFWQIGNLRVQTGGIGDFFLPYGAILFSLWGASLIPEVEEMLKERKNDIRKIVPVAIVLPACVYLIFIFLIVGITGADTSEEVVSGLKTALGDGITILIALFGLITTFTSFVALGLTLKKIFKYDLEIKEFSAWLAACSAPLIFYLIGLQDFIGVIGFVGAVMLAIEGILIVLMYRKLTDTNNSEEIKLRKLRFLTYPLMIFLGLGIVYQVIYFLK